MNIIAKLAEHTEEQDAEYLRCAIANKQASEIMNMVRQMDAIVHDLGIEDSFDCPVEEIRRLKRKAGD